MNRTRATWHTVAETHDVVGQSGRHRRLLVVARCWFCGNCHVHNAAADAVEVTRNASCKRGRYLLRAAVSP